MLVLVGFLVTSLGSILGVAGALMMARLYHPFSFLGFIGYSFRLTRKFISSSHQEFLRSAEISERLGSINSTRRGYSLIGLYLVFLGFCMQLLGSIISFTSTYFSCAAPNSPH